jgi:hypothetical protein
MLHYLTMDTIAQQLYTTLYHLDAERLYSPAISRSVFVLFIDQPI